MSTQQQLDYVTNTSVTNTIEEYNDLQSPYIVALYTVDKTNKIITKVKGNNWTINNSSFIKTCLPETDSISIRVDPITELKYKNITGITVKFNTIIENEDAIPKLDSISAILFDKEYPIIFDRKIGTENVFECALFNNLPTSSIYNAIQAYEFYIKLNFNGNHSNCNLTIYGLSIEIEFDNKLETEKEAMYSRLEPYFNDIDLELLDLSRKITGDSSGIELYSDNPIEIMSDDDIMVHAYYMKDGTEYDIEYMDIKWYMSNIKDNGVWVGYEYLGATNTDDSGIASLAYTKKDFSDFNLKCVLEGNKNIYPAMLSEDFTVTKYSVDFNVETDKASYEVVNSTIAQSDILLYFDTNINEDYPLNITIQLLNSSNGLLKTYTKNNATGTFNVTIPKGDYNSNLNKIKIFVNEGEFNKYSEQVIPITINNTQTATKTYKNTSISILYTHSNYYNDTCTIIVRDKDNVNTKCGGSCTVKIGSKTFTVNSNSSTEYTFKYDSSHGITDKGVDGAEVIYPVNITYKGNTVGDIVYNTSSTTININIKTWKTSTRFFNNYAGYSENTDSGSYRKWYTLNSGSTHLNICGGTSDSTAIASSSGTHKKPRLLKCYNASFNTAVKINKVTVSYQEANFPKNDSLSASNACNITNPDKHCHVYIPERSNETQHGTATSIPRTDGKTNNYVTRTYSRTGNWNASDINKISMYLHYNANNNGNPGRLKVRNCKITVVYRYPQGYSN